MAEAEGGTRGPVVNAPQTHDHADRADLPEYHRFRQSLSDLLNAGGFTLDDITDMVRTAYAGDFCNCPPCMQQFQDGQFDDPTCWPHAAEVDQGWMVGTYRCPRTGRTWTCGYTADPGVFRGL